MVNIVNVSEAMWIHVYINKYDYICHAVDCRCWSCRCVALDKVGECVINKLDTVIVVDVGVVGLYVDIHKWSLLHSLKAVRTSVLECSSFKSGEDLGPGMHCHSKRWELMLWNALSFKAGGLMSWNTLLFKAVRALPCILVPHAYCISCCRCIVVVVELVELMLSLVE